MSTFIFILDYLLTIGFCVFLYLSIRRMFGWLLSKRKTWEGYNINKLQYLAEIFALEPHTLSLAINEAGLMHENTFRMIYDGIGSAGVYIGEDRILFIDTRCVRNEKDLIETFLHEICHHNQFVQGRLVYGKKGRYRRRPIEREADSFSKAWFKTALALAKGWEINNKNK